MVKQGRQEAYRIFLDLVQREIQRERLAVNQQMKSIFIWCFLIPAAFSFSSQLLVRFKILPAVIRWVADSSILIFPIFYFIYFLSSEVLRDVPTAVRRGAMSNLLVQADRQGQWREKICDEFSRVLPKSEVSDWNWIVLSFRIDLKNINYQTRYLTALAGAVFFLIMQGIDFIGDQEDAIKGPVEQSWQYLPQVGVSHFLFGFFGQFVGLGLFLLLLYWSGRQTHQFLSRYLDCAELMIARLSLRSEGESTLNQVAPSKTEILKKSE